MSARIMVVDDEVHLARIIQFTLEHEGYDVITAFDGAEAIRMAERHRPDLIILDLMLPVIDGYRVCNALKEREWSREVPIIILTARDISSEKIDEPLGADLCMSKPFNAEDLVATVRDLLSRSQSSASFRRDG